MPKKDLKARYQGDWALVTGGSSGVGEEYCYELAKYGFNIVLMGKNEKDLGRVASNLRDIYNVKSKVLRIDFSLIES